MLHNWKQWEGHAVDGKFPLLRYLGGSDDSAVFLTERHANQGVVNAAIKLALAEPENGDLQVRCWRQAAALSHPNLISLHEMGRCELGGMSLVYVVMEYAEENLAQILPGRPLTPEENRAMLESVLGVLADLHGKGFVHGHIKPGNILATADQLKISSDELCRVGESPVHVGHHGAYDAPENAVGVIPMPRKMSPACDVWSLGVTLVEATTQKLPIARGGEQQDPLLPQALPEPFLDIAKHCLLRHPQSRWTVDQIAARLQGPAAIPQPPAAQERASAPARAPQPVALPRRPAGKRRTNAAPIYVGAALVLAAMLVGPKLLRRHSETEAPQTAVPTATATQPVDSPATAQPVPPAKELPHKSIVDETATEAEPSPNTPAPVPTSIHPAALATEEAAIAEKGPAGASLSGAVAHQVDPEVLLSARNSIRGTVKVIVRVDVDRSGGVEDAELETPGPSKYFARAALQAAKLWKFKPPTLGNQGVLSTWTLRFEFTRDGTKVVPTQETP